MGWVERCAAQARLYQPSSGSLRSRCATKARYFGSPAEQVDAAKILAKPVWSLRSLLPVESSRLCDPITSEQLHHILRLSALPLPKNDNEEESMIKVLQSQLHFVQDIQRVETAGVEPLNSIRDDTDEGREEITIGVEQLRSNLQDEIAYGHRKRPRRITRTQETETPESANFWDPLQGASKRAGRYFVVHSGKI